MRHLSVMGLTGDGQHLLLRDGQDTFELALSDVRQAEQAATPVPTDVPPTPREIQRRIRYGEHSADIARRSGLPLAAVARYEGPVLAEREHQARSARRAQVAGRVVEDLVEQHLAVTAREGVETVWDCWLTEPGRWEVRVHSGSESLRLRWDPQTRQVGALDERGRQALLLDPDPQDALGAVLRPVAGRPPAATAAPSAAPTTAPARPAVARRSGRAQIPAWAEITGQVSGRPQAPGGS